MNSVVIWNHLATGEGSQFRIFFSNSGRMSDEEAVELMKSRLDPYFHVSIKTMSLEEVQKNAAWTGVIRAHCPLLMKFIEGKRDYVIKVDYHAYINYS